MNKQTDGSESSNEKQITKNTGVCKTVSIHCDKQAR